MSLPSRLDRMTPATNSISAATMTKPQTIRVGKRGTSPVTKYSVRTGTMNSRLMRASTAAMAVKKPKGK